ncbi:MAG: S-layer homology domain-containing protein, partial [Candidatus Gracilibacteria bacterium]
MHKFTRTIASISLVAIISSLVVSTAVAGTFGDVPADAYYYTAVEQLADDGVLDSSKESFMPASLFQRDQAAKLVVLGAGITPLENPASPTFTDVPKTAWSFQYVETAAAHQIVSGYATKPGYYGPGDPVTREQYAKMLVEAYGWDLLDPATPTFPDVPSTSWAYKYVETAYHWSVINGMSDGKFHPTDNIYRQDSALMTYRAKYEAEERTDDDVPVVGGGDLVVELSADSPAGDTIPDGATAVPVAAWDFTAGDNGATIESLVVHTYGVTALAASHNVYLYDGNDRLTSGKSVNGTTNEATFTNIDFDVPAGETKTLTLKLTTGTANSYTAATEAAFELASAAAVDAGDSEVSGDFPIQGEKFGISATNGGTLTIQKNGTITNPKVGEDDVVIAKFKMDASTESAELEQLGLLVTGTVSNDAVKNLELYVSGTDDPIATVDGLNASDIAVFMLDTPYEIVKGETKNFTVKADFDSGRSGDTVFVYVDETTDVVSIGATYGYGMLVVTNTATTGYDGVTTACTATAGTCSYSTMEGGDITVTSNGPVTSTYGLGASDVHLLDFTIVSVSNITVKNLPVHVVTNSTAAGATGLLTAASVANYTDFKIINTETGETVMGPVDATSLYTTAYATVVTEGAATDDDDGYYLFADEFDMSSGEELKLALTMDIANGASTGETIYGALELGTTYPQMKDTNNKTITNSSSLVPASTLTGKTMTLATPSLSLALAAVPASKTYVKGTSDVKFVGVSAQCGAASDCKVTDAVIKGYIDDSGTADNWQSDSAAADHATSMTAYVGSVKLVDSAGTVVGASQSLSCTTSTCTATFDNMAWMIDAGSTEVFYVVGKISGDSFADTDAENIAFGVAAAGDIDFEDDDGNTRDSTGTVNATATGATDPSTFVTTAAGGVLTVAVDSSTPNENIVVAGASDQ